MSFVSHAAKSDDERRRGRRGASGEVTTIRVSGEASWAGAAVVGGVVYSNTSGKCSASSTTNGDVLSVDARSGTATRIPIGDVGLDVLRDGYSWPAWWGAAAVGGVVCFGPYHHADVLLLDSVSGDVAAVPTGRDGQLSSGMFSWKHSPSLPTGTLATSTCGGGTGLQKWRDGTVVGARAYFAPYDHDAVLVVDPARRDTTLVPTGQTGNSKWWGAASAGGAAWFGPADQDDVLELDAATDDVRFVPTGRTGSRKWAGGRLICKSGKGARLPETSAHRFAARICKPLVGGAAAGSTLYFAPYLSADVLVVDTCARAVSFVPTGDDGDLKWSGAVAVGGGVYRRRGDEGRRPEYRLVRITRPQGRRPEYRLVRITRPQGRRPEYRLVRITRPQGRRTTLVEQHTEG
eukprot:gene11407-biopygen8203